MKALILAGSRPGGDPLAAFARAEHKALIEIGDRTMLARVADAVRRAGMADIAVSTNGPAVAAAAERLGLVVLPAAAGPSDSVGAVLDALGTPLLVTTADHALLDPAWIAAFVADAPATADVAILLASREAVERAVPGSRRTYLRFADGAWSGCNLFLLRTPDACRAIALWRQVEADRKRPWRIVRRFGIGLLLRYLLGRLTLAEAVARLGRTAGIDAAVVAARDGLAAVDVDTPEDLATVRALVERR